MSTLTAARPQQAPPAHPPFYGWRIVGFAAVMLAMTAPGQTVGVSVFVDPMMGSLELTRSQLAAAYMVGTLAGALTLPLIGRWIDRFGVRLMTTVIATAFGTVLVAMSGVAGLVTVGIGFAGIRMLGQGSLSLTSTTAVALWFDRRRGLAIGLSSAAGGAAMSMAPLALSALIERFDWRLSWSLAGIAVWLIVLPIARWGLRDGPCHGTHLVEVVRASSAAGSAGVAAPATTMSFTRPEALRTLMFWAVTAAVATSGLITTGLAFHQISLLGERGLSVAQAAANFLPQTAAAIAATLLMGPLVDRIRPRLLIAASMVSLAGAMILVQVASPGATAICFGLAAGTGAGAVRTLEAAAFPRYFGVAHIGEIRGLVMAISVGATAFGPLLLAGGFERYGSYGPVLTMLLALPIGAAMLASFAPLPRKQSGLSTAHIDSEVPR